MRLALPSRLRGSLALRVPLASVVFGLVVAGCTVAVGVWNLSHQLDERAALEMEGRRELLVHLLGAIPSVADIGESRDRFSHLFFGHDTLHLALNVAETGRVLVAFSETAAQSVTLLAHTNAGPDVTHTWVAPGGARFSGLHGTGKFADGREVEYSLSIDRQRALMAASTVLPSCKTSAQSPQGRRVGGIGFDIQGKVPGREGPAAGRRPPVRTV